MGCSIVYIQGSKVYNFQIKTVIFSLKFIFILANSVDPDEMPHDVAFHLGLHCLPKYAFRSHNYTKGYPFKPFDTTFNLIQRCVWSIIHFRGNSNF